jgi:hypothetical protein
MGIRHIPLYYVGQGKLKGRVIKKYKQATSESIEIPSSRGLFFRSKKEVLNVYNETGGLINGDF